MAYQHTRSDEHMDGVRRVVVLKRGKETWHVDVGDSMNDAHAREIAEAQSDTNGGGWKYHGITNQFPHEIGGEDEG